MNNKVLGTIGMVGAPFLGIDFYLNGGGFGGEAYEHTSQTGLFCLIYMSAWMCSIWAFIRTNAAGTGKGRYVLLVQLIFLAIANASNVYEIISPETASGSFLYNAMDIFWPISNLFMMATGIAILNEGKLEFPKSWSPLFAGLWIPFSIAMYFVVGDKVHPIVAGLYSAIAWALMGYVVRTLPVRPRDRELTGARVNAG